MAKVGIVMGSDSDMPIMAQAAEVLEQFGIDFEMTIISAHRFPLFYRTDAVRNPGSDRSDQRRKERRNPCGKDPCSIRSGTP